jgi:fructose-bisphosphate aldolase class II
MQRMREWAKGAGKDVKFATKQFKAEIDAIPAEFAGKIEEAARREALQLFRAFRAEGTAKIVADTLAVKA